MLVVAAPGHPWARRRSPLPLAEIAAAPLVMREAGSGTTTRSRPRRPGCCPWRREREHFLCLNDLYVIRAYYLAMKLSLNVGNIHDLLTRLECGEFDTTQKRVVR
jgi:DNA-binding transcriptional LysR family regulator